MLSQFRYVILAVFIFVAVLVVSCSQRRSSVPPDEFIQQARAELLEQTAAHAANWGFGQQLSWNLNQDDGVVSFTFADGAVVTAPAQMVGTYNIRDKTFLWAWAHPDVQESCCNHAELALQFGKRNELVRFTSPKLTCTEDDAWGFTATAAKLGNAKGAFLAEDRGAVLYMTVGDVTVNK